MSNILRKLLRQQKKDTRINWVHNEELRAYLRVSLDVVFALDEKVGRIALEAFLSYVNGIGADDIERAKALVNPQIDEWMVHQMPAVLEGKVAVAPGQWVPVQTSGLRHGGIIKDEQLRSLVEDETIPDVAPFEGMGTLPPDPLPE